MNEVENKKQTPESPARPENKKIYCRPRPYARFTPKLKEVTKLLQKSFPKLFTRKPEPKYALKIGIYNDIISLKLNLVKHWDFGVVAGVIEKLLKMENAMISISMKLHFMKMK